MSDRDRHSDDSPGPSPRNRDCRINGLARRAAGDDEHFVAIGEPGRREAQVDWPVRRQKREHRHLAELLGVRIERDPRRLTLDSQPRVDRAEP